MENNMKYIKLYEEYGKQQKLPLDMWQKFEEVNKLYGNNIWEYEKLYIDSRGNITYDNKDYEALDGEDEEDSYPFDLTGLLLKDLSTVFPYHIKKFTGSVYLPSMIERLNNEIGEVSNYFVVRYAAKLTSLKGSPKKVGSLSADYTGIQTLEGCPIIKNDANLDANVKLVTLKGVSHKALLLNIRGSKVTSLKYMPKICISFYCNDVPTLVSQVNDNGIEVSNHLNFDSNKLIKSLDDGSIPIAVWFESFCFIGARDTDTLTQLYSTIPNYCKFTDEQVEEYLNSPLIDRKSTEEDWKAVKDILNRTKKYDHSEYRDSKLDSEWKEIF